MIGRGFFVMPIALVGWMVLSFGDLRADDAPILKSFVKRHCYECHRGTSPEAGLNLETLGTDLSNAEQQRIWVLAHDRISAGTMPPKDASELKTAERKQFVSHLSTMLTKADSAQRQVVLRRLNRVEYENTIRDLFGVRVALKNMLPEDATAHGFDNIGSALAISTEQMQVYLKAADTALDEVFGFEERPKQIKLRFPLSQDTERQHGKLFLKTDEGVVAFTSGYCPTTFRTFRPRVKGTYRVKIHAKTFQTDKPVIMEVYGGDVITHRRPYHLVGHYDIAPGDKWTVVEFTDTINRFDSFHPKPFGLSHRKDKRFEGIGLLIGDVEVEGPLESWPAPSRLKLLGDVDLESGTIADAQSILARVLPSAFRRETTDDEVLPYLGLVKKSLADGRSFEASLRVGLKAVLCSPEFLYLENNSTNKTIDDFALASRLSYFLWSSMPDKTLFALATKGTLSKPDVLRSQTERMLKDPKASAFIENFTGQWLDLRDIDFTQPDRKLYPEFDDLLRASMVKETQSYFRVILEENRSLLEFVDSDWTILNQRLAEHYEIPGVTGQTFRRVTLPTDSIRGGVLTQASVLKVTANGTNTSPVVRGAWVLENIIGKPTSPPPPGIPAIEPDIRGATTIREQLDKHRNIASCAVCHAQIDPPGFALEQFDVIGGRRDWYRSAGAGERVNRFMDNIGVRRVLYRKGPDVNATGHMADGRKFADIRQLKKLLLSDPDQIARCLTENVSTYALGRGLGFSDRPEVKRIIGRLREKNYGFRTLVHEIVQSAAFRQP